MEREIKIRDLRKKEKFVIDDAYLNGYAKLCGIYATGVYMALCRHADKNQYCFPSYNKIGEELAISIASVKRGVAKLLEWNIIEVVREKKTDGKWQNNAYILRDKSEWKPKPEVCGSSGEESNQRSNRTEPEVCGDENQGSVGAIKETQYEGNTYKDLQPASPLPGDKSKKPKSQHQKFIEFFFETTQATRGIKLVITGADGKNLKRILDLHVLEPADLEKLALYFLADFRFKEFSPSISTFLSAGILNGLVDQMRNGPEFWKKIDLYQIKYRNREIKVDTGADKKNSEILKKLEEMKKKLFNMPN